MIVDVHRHVVVEEMTAPAVPERWRPAYQRENGRYRLAFRGRDIAAEELVLGGNAARLLGILDG